ncbi:DUF2064 domain-containing protein [Tenacibaculum maritimum]|uniref:DUF2064 domain-containing protein n=1 Tax=Tenacibaculum maritimum TaxID=107401 RepID=UPI0010A58038|nr:DUF2064 domain-containing protein [Tenacibaculum maritimum]QCD63213.1 hypothetical protein B9C57_12080 [Tenacibaculum maritimum]
MTNSKTAILIFANSATYEAISKPFHKSAAVFDILNKQTLQTVQKTGIPYFLFTEKNQKGISFGERYVNAIKTVFKLGYNAVITIGNDTPQLKTSDLLHTICQINTPKNNTIIGPSTDGGFYLIGIQKEHFDEARFLALPWQTNQLLSSLTFLLKNTTTKISYLKALADIDHIKDAKLFLNKYAFISNHLRYILRSIFLFEKKITPLITESKTTCFSTFFYNKGSPLFA